MPDTLTPEIRRAVVQDIASLAREKYVFPDVGERMANYIEAKLEQGGYDDIGDGTEFALALTVDGRQVSNDQHWVVMYDAGQATAAYLDQESTDEEAQLAGWREQLRRANYGFEKVERLTGNIGYIDLRTFAWPAYGGDTAVAALNFVAHCDALIFDLRRNHGGEGEMLQLIVSYLFNVEPVHLTTFYSRPTDEYQQLWTLPYVPGKRLPDAPVYVLTSRATGSAGEEFAYNLKHRGRGIVVGETTLGAAHLNDMEIVQGRFQVLYSFARTVNPITKGNWEGVGVEPDIAVPQEEALKTAHLYALEQLLAGCQDDPLRRDLEWDLEIARSLYTPVTVDETSLSCYVGQYGQRTFALEEGALTYAHGQSAVYKLVPITQTRFRLDEEIKFEFVLDEQGAVSSVVITYRDGRPEATAAKDRG